jgi:hypothetical protein
MQRDALERLSKAELIAFALFGYLLIPGVGRVCRRASAKLLT